MKRKTKWIAFLLFFFLVLSLFPRIAYAASGDTIVYRTKTGKCYHTITCSSVKKSCYEISLQEAVNMGLTPCSKCHPPTLDEAVSSRSIPSSRITASSVFVDGTKFKVTITTTCIINDNVGNEWNNEFSIGDYAINSEDVIALNQNDVLEISTTITENDKDYPDVGEATTTYKVTETDLAEGFTVKQTIDVEENAGRYEGNTATWVIEYQFTRY